jgi:UDP:flavonoid glycosyltransferase YjiC (YdhE family)
VIIPHNYDQIYRAERVQQPGAGVAGRIEVQGRRKAAERITKEFGQRIET